MLATKESQAFLENENDPNEEKACDDETLVETGRRLE